MTSKRMTIQRTTSRPSLRFSPYAWGKLIYLRDRGDTEMGGFGLSAEGDPLLIVDVLTVKQRCSSVTVAFDDAAVADLCDALVDQGFPPERFLRVWIHTHPGDCPRPSGTDEATFRRVFGCTDWSVMAILAQQGATYARLQFYAGPGAALTIPVLVDYGQPFDAADWAAWDREFLAHVIAEPLVRPPFKNQRAAIAEEGQALDFTKEDDLWQSRYPTVLNDKRSLYPASVFCKNPSP